MAREILVEHPPHACEIGAGALAGALLTSSGAVESVGVRKLPTGAVKPSLTEINALDAPAVQAALAETLHALGNPRECVAIIPDATVRIVLMDFDSLPSKRAEAEQLVHARLRKSLPFDADDSVISYQSTVESDRTQVVAVVILRSVLEEYEAMFRAAGSEPGVVLPSTLAALGCLEADVATLFLKLDESTTSVAIVSQNQLRLFRTHEGGRTLTAEQIAADIFPSLVYFKDNFGEKLQRIVYSGPPFEGELRSLLEQQTGARLEFLRSKSSGEAMAAEASGAVGALSQLRLGVNLATKPYRDVKRYLMRSLPWVGALAVLSVALAFYAGHRQAQGAATTQQLNQLRAQMDEQERLRSHAEKVLGDVGEQSMLANSRVFNDAIARKRFSWTTYFMRMERLIPPNMRLASVHPRLRDDDFIDLDITAEASERAPIVELMRRMEGSDYFATVRLSNEALVPTKSDDGGPEGAPMGNFHRRDMPQVEIYTYTLHAIYIQNGKGGRQ